jgi:hypothetical protein
MPNNHFSKKDHLSHHAQVGQFELGKALISGATVDPQEHAKLNAMRTESENTEHLFLCAACLHTYEPHGVPENNDLRMWPASILLPDGTMHLPGVDHHNRDMVFAVAIGPCCKQIRDNFAKALMLDWHTVDHLAQPILSKENPESSNNDDPTS